jgi:tripartite ATP-independent transporter DctM subunit
MAVLIIVLVITMLIGMPIAFSVGVASLAHLELVSDLPAMLLPQKMFTGVDYFSLVAVPFFILAGELMAKAKITDSIVEFSQYIVGRFSGGLAHVNIISSMFFAGITGAAVADTAALGPILIPAMEKEGYPRPYAAAVTAASSVMGPIIPPSLLMILYALIDGRVSVGALFLAGCVPRVLIGLSQMVVAAFIARRNNYPKFDKKFMWTDFFRAARKAILPMMTPIIILGGILGGVFTPTEAGAVAALYAFMIGFFVLKTLKLKNLPEIMLNTVHTTAMVFLIFCTAMVFGALITFLQVPAKLTGIITSISTSPIVFLILVNILLLLIGCVMEVGVAIIILVPVLVPVAMAYGIDQLHFAVIVVLNLCVGLITPPMGVVLFVACGVSKVSVEGFTKSI